MATAATAPDALRACHACGLVQRVPPLGPGARARCPRCRTTVLHARARDYAARSSGRAAALALTALVLYPAAITLPVLRLERFGHARETTIWSGAIELMASREWFVGLVVFSCSIVIPLAKLLGLFLLCTRIRFFPRRHRMLTYRAIDWVGRWGMIDVLLVALLVAAVKLGNWMDVTPGPGAAVFAAVVVLSMLATAAFDPAAIWEEEA